MEEPALNPETAAARPNPLGIDPLFLNRWSPRAYLAKPVAAQDLRAVLEAARWAPSCFNEQPWRFIVAQQPQDLERLRGCLTAKNRAWADRVPVLLVVISHPRFALDQSPNRWHDFDAGTAWGYLALEAWRRGLAAHGMGGFSMKKVRETFGIPEDWGVHAVVALGYPGSKAQLPAELQETETPSTRRPLEQTWAEGKFAF
jgi:nitroreductase